jgi:prophage regulatory protein
MASTKPQKRGSAKARDGLRAPAAPPVAAVGEIREATLHGQGSNRLDSAPIDVSDDEFWGIKAVTARTGLSRSSIYSYVDLGLFPRQRRLGPRRVGWLASEVRTWIASRPL